MIVLSSFINSVAVVLGIIIQTLLILITIRVILSWVNPDPYNPIVRFIVSATDPLIELFRPLGKYINPKNSRIDFVPMLLILALIFLQSFLVQVLYDYAQQLRLSAGL